MKWEKGGREERQNGREGWWGKWEGVKGGGDSRRGVRKKKGRE